MKSYGGLYWQENGKYDTLTIEYQQAIAKREEHSFRYEKRENRKHK